ncbi:MAG: T9SS type A sorting domain-containing protein [Candidatus Cloacimonetes bacterium]|nr:T9SS type A sorting domain-containing protein [Candidatus Cloacimonadota bacterium]
MKSKALILLLLATLTFLSAVPRELVVVEIATGTWCGYCPGAAMGAHDLLNNGHAVAIVKNHNGDSFANTYSNARNNYYGVTGFPTAYFDGLNPTSGGSATASMYSNYLPKVNARLSVPSKYTISASGMMSGNEITVLVTVAKPEADTNTNVVLHSSLTQSNIPFNWGNQSTVDNVNRIMSPSQTGTPINLGTGESTTVNLTFTLNTAWNFNVNDLELVLWLQNTQTKETLQGKKYSVPTLTGAFPASMESINFPDMYVNGVATQQLVFNNFSESQVNATLSVDNSVFGISANTLTIPAMQSRSIDVTFAPTAAQAYTANLSVTGNFLNHPSLTIPLSGTGFTNAAPTATNVLISGPPVIMQTLTSSYTFADTDGNTEGTSLKKWYRVIGGTPQLIPDANADSYIITEADLGLPLAFEITPVDQHGMPGTPVMSENTLPIEALPAPANFAGELTPPDTVVLTWERPPHFDAKGFVGYRLYRNGLNISTITNVNTLTFTDTYVPQGTHEYWICSMFNNPMALSEPSPIVTIQIGPNSNDDLVNIPVFSAYASPNPFSASTAIQMRSKANSEIKLSIYNLKGQMLQSWTLRADASGNALQSWDTNESGIYLYRVLSEGKTLTGKLIRVK